MFKKRNIISTLKKCLSVLVLSGLFFCSTIYASKAASYCDINPTVPDCAGYKAYCDINPGFPYCQGFTSICQSSPNSPECLGLGNYCNSNAINNSWCVGGWNALCQADANDPACNNMPFCQSNPSHPYCVGWVAYCSGVGVSDAFCVGLITFCPSDPANPSCQGVTSYCRNSPDNMLCMGRTAYCDAYKPDIIDCYGSPSYCKLNEYVNEPICTIGTAEYCKNGAYNGGGGANCTSSMPTPEYCKIPGNETYAGCIPGNPTYCEVIANGNTSCTPGHADYCAVDIYRLEPVCVEGDPAYCKLPQHINESVCIVGDDAFCEFQHNKSNPACIVGQPEFCALPQHENHTECPGTISYCTKYPQSTYCDLEQVENSCVTAGNCTTQYQVNITNKSTTIGTMLCQMVYYTRSDIGRAIAILGVIIVAIGAMFAQIHWSQGLAAVAGIAAILGASELLVYVGSNISSLSGVLACLKNI